MGKNTYSQGLMMGLANNATNALQSRMEAKAKAAQDQAEFERQKAMKDYEYQIRLMGQQPGGADYLQYYNQAIAPGAGWGAMAPGWQHAALGAKTNANIWQKFATAGLKGGKNAYSGPTTPGPGAYYNPFGAPGMLPPGSPFAQDQPGGGYTPPGYSPGWSNNPWGQGGGGGHGGGGGGCKDGSCGWSKGGGHGPKPKNQVSNSAGGGSGALRDYDAFKSSQDDDATRRARYEAYAASPQAAEDRYRRRRNDPANKRGAVGGSNTRNSPRGVSVSSSVSKGNGPSLSDIPRQDGSGKKKGTSRSNVNK